MSDASATALPMTAPAIRVRDVDDATLAEEVRDNGLALKLDELRTIARELGRDPTVVEAHVFDAAWSEHCSYKSSRHYLRRLPTEGPTVMQGPQEDAGIIHLGEWNGDRYGIVIAHESHNHPSQVVPFEGAATGIGGIVRDVLCMGAEVIALADPLRFGPLDDPHSRYVAQGVVDGIAAYGNAIGVPNIGGDVYFHDGFRDNCLVNVVALGLVKQQDIIHSHAPAGSAGWDIVLVGKATDRSGFGGAAFSSLVLDEADAEQNKGAVQVPDPFLKSVIMRASYRAFAEIRARGLTVGYKDLGAGGIAGCTNEIVGAGGFGAIVDLDRCPTAIPNLLPEVIAVGETQERLAWVVPPEFTPVLLAIYNEEFSLPQVARGACAAVIGTVTEEKTFVLRYGGDDVLRVPIDFLTAGIRYDRACEMPPALPRRAAALATSAPAWTPSLATLCAVLAHRDVCSRAPIFERYDSVVRGVTQLSPGYADAGVIAPIPGAPLGMALSVDGNPRHALVDPQRAGELAVCESVRNVVAVGARPAGLTDCLNFGNPEDPRQMGEFVAALDGIAHAARELAVPFVSGNVSLYNQSASGQSIPPSPIIACVGVIDDVSFTATPGLKRAASSLYFVGAQQHALAGSVIAEILGDDGSPLPSVDYDALRAEIAFVLTAQRAGAIVAAHDVADGGTLAAIVEMAFAAFGDEPIGADLDPAAFATVAQAFGEYGGFVVEVVDADAFERSAREMSAAIVRLGSTTSRADIAIGDASFDLEALREAWTSTLRDFYQDAAR